jgi:hypothetical protein
MKKGGGHRKRLAYWKSYFDDGGFQRRPNDSAAVAAPALLQAAEFFGLDPAKDRDLLLHILASIVFGKRKKGRPGGTRNWDEKRFSQLGFHREAVERDNPGIGDKRAATEIKRRHSEYRDSVEVIRQRLPYARHRFETKAKLYRAYLESQGKNSDGWQTSGYEPKSPKMRGRFSLRDFVFAVDALRDLRLTSDGRAFLRKRLPEIAHIRRKFAMLVKKSEEEAPLDRTDTAGRHIRLVE